MEVDAEANDEAVLLAYVVLKVEELVPGLLLSVVSANGYPVGIDGMGYALASREAVAVNSLCVTADSDECDGLGRQSPAWESAMRPASTAAMKDLV